MLVVAAAVVVLVYYRPWRSPAAPNPTTQPAAPGRDGNETVVAHVDGNVVDPDPPKPPPPPIDNRVTKPPPPPVPPATRPVKAPDKGSGPDLPDRTIPVAEATTAYRRGVKLMEAQQFLPARAALSKALASGRLTAVEEEDARANLKLLADITIFSPQVLEGDPLCFTHVFSSGEFLAGPRGLIRRNNLRVPPGAIVRVNRLPGAEAFQAGRKYKLLRGPFHAVVHKSRRVMDLYLQRTFVKRFRVCIGAKDTPTPEGSFRVLLGGKTKQSTYYAPAGSNVPAGGISPGQEGYPLDKDGHNIKIVGIPERGTRIDKNDGYAIHGTNDPGSIGKATSMGCVRLSDHEIREVYDLLYEHWSTVTIRP